MAPLCAAILAGAALATVACGGSPSPSFDSGRDAGSFERDASAPDTSTPGDVPLPPEHEERRSFQTPRAGGRYVYVANPPRDSVAVIDSRTLAIHTVEAGDGPTYLSTLPGRDEALVLNVGSRNATILRTDETGTRTSFVPVAEGANAIAIAPDGRHAIAYLDTTAEGASITSGSFQDITVITLQDGMDRAVQLSVGFRPIDVQFAADGSTAFVVTEDGISIVRFADVTGPTIVPNVSLGDTDVVVPGRPDAGAPMDAGGELDASTGEDAGEDAGTVAEDGRADASVTPEGDGLARDISITADGRFAIARVEGSSVLRMVDLARRTIHRLDVGAAVTDLDISPSSDMAIAVLRSESAVVRIPLPGAFTEAAPLTRTDLAGELVGSITIAPDGRRALLYTTAAPVERLTVLDLAGSEGAYALRLRKPVRAVAFSPDSRTALVVNTRIPGDPNDPNADLETRIDRSFGYTLIDPAMHFAKLQLTPADVGPFAIVPDGSTSFLLLRDDVARVALVHRISMRSFAIEPLSLGSPPSSVGAVPATMRAFIGQEHPEGRITFVDWTTGAVQSVTGFELNSRVVD